MKKSIFVVGAAALFAFSSVFGAEEVEAAAAGDVIEAGESVLGTPYEWGGTTTTGFDCSGFTQYAFSHVGIDLPRTAAEQYNVGESVERSQLQPGDLVFFDTRGGPTHNGIYIGDNQFIHSSSSNGVSIDSMDNVYWEPRYIGARRVLDETHAETASQDVMGESTTTGSSSVEVYVDGTPLDVDQGAEITENERTLVPMRAIFEELGAEVDWDESASLVKGELGNTTVELTIDEEEAFVSGESVLLDQPAELMNERTMVPLRFVGESLGADVDWDDQENAVIIETN
ncbi:NlpC/P60 family protein [Alkalicoccus chagannorensis]|uniref:NlpC/P60 family protein n=1 Tax=Alkalicoccus chagannorensis TaxID=427072 RepID=UPI000417C0C9|nr:NlpC/P60 family protein [Alkalicoccus chagannorensis]